MSRVLAYTSPARGHLFPATSILLALAARGHEVSVRTLASQVPLLRGLGLDAEAIDPRIEAVVHDDWKARTPVGGLGRAMAVFGARAPLDAADLAHALEQTSPDLLLVDINAWGALATAQRWGGPWASFCPYPLALSSSDAPPFGPGWAPASSPATRLRDRALGPLLRGSMARAMLPALDAVRADAGLPALRGIDDVFTSIPLLLALTAEPFEYPHRDWPDSVVMVGPCAWDPPADPPAWLDEVQGPLVLVTTSSEFQDDARLVRTALAALADEPVTVVATLPSAALGSVDVPANARVETFVPHGPLLERAACVVTHGGMGATQKALAQGVPVCVVPFGRDQPEVARRVEVARAGTRLPAGRLTPARLRLAVREAMNRRDGAQRVAAGFAAAGGPDRAAQELETLLAGSRAATG